MFSKLFYLLLRTILLPWGTIWLITNSSDISDQVIFIAVAVAYSVLTVFMVLWHALKIIPNLALIRLGKSAYLLLEVVIEILSIVALWIGYVITFAK
ncbi:MAG: hypothetical protein JNK26_02120 [Candidatus Doudnabacteria bacterium]|nr:hypothetical protein [Candidatus Doudnabacteria bacterium]